MQNVINSYDEISRLSSDAPYYFNGEKTYTTGWKMHLFLNKGNDVFPDLHDRTIQEVSKFLISENLEHKFKNGCDGANTFCIYVGSRDDCEELALKLATKFAKEFQRLSPQGNKFSGSDKNMFGNPNIGIRFDGVNENLSNSPFSRYGEKGIPDFLRKVYFASSVLGKKVSYEQEEKLKKVVCHLILARYCGEKYLGKNYKTKPWDQKLFDSISEFSSDDVKKYTQRCISMFHPRQYIKPTSLSTEECEINIDEKMKTQSNSQQPQNKLFIKNHGFSIVNADNISMSETKDKNGTEITWNKTDKPLAKYTIMKDGHSFITLYDDKGNEDRFLLYDNQIYQIKYGKAEILESVALASRIKNIESESLVIKSRLENIPISQKSPKVR